MVYLSLVTVLPQPLLEQQADQLGLVLVLLVLESLVVQSPLELPPFSYLFFYQVYFPSLNLKNKIII